MHNNRKAILSCRDLVVRFPGVIALNHADFDLYPGEIHALIGENGAGKSTLMKTFLGINKPYSGNMFRNGQPFAPRCAAEALDAGISMIHQEISLAHEMSVAENIFLGREKKFGKIKGIVDKKSQNEAATRILESLGIAIDPEKKVSKLSISQMQLVEIARAISYDSDIIIMDEPTSALARKEVEQLYEIVRDLAAQGKSIVFISHKLDEIYAICDSVTVMRDGVVVDRKPISEISQQEMIQKMIDRKLDNIYPKAEVAIGDCVLDIRNLERTGKFHNVNFSVRHGEILGFYGLMGAGRTEIMEAIFGINPPTSGDIYLEGKKIDVSSVRDGIRNKMAMVTEDRLRKGAFHGLSIQSNILVSSINKISRWGILNGKKAERNAKQMCDTLSVKRTSEKEAISLLSGGNQQKVIIGRWLMTEPDILIMDEPTRGIDVNAKAEIYVLMGELVSQGKTILMVSSELPELMGICDRIVIVHNGTTIGEVSRSDFDAQRITSFAFGMVPDRLNGEAG